MVLLIREPPFFPSDFSIPNIIRELTNFPSGKFDKFYTILIEIKVKFTLWRNLILQASLIDSDDYFLVSNLKES